MITFILCILVSHLDISIFWVAYILPALLDLEIIAYIDSRR